MSGTIFKGRLGKGELERSATYKPGEGAYDPALVDDIIKEFLGMTPKDRYLVPTWDDGEFFERCVEGFTRKLQPGAGGDFDSQSFLDALVRELTVREAGIFHLSRMDTMFSPLLQALYRIGYNGFCLDALHLPVRPFRMMTSLSGTADNPLRAAYNGAVWCFGEYASHCSLECVGEVQYMAGQKAEHSELLLHVPPEEMGDSAEDTAFFLPGVDEVTLPQILDYIYPPRIQVIIKKGELVTEATIERHFFTKGNNIYIPDGNGWRGVR